MKEITEREFWYFIALTISIGINAILLIPHIKII